MGKFNLIIFIVFSILACQPSERARPYGYLRLGKIQQYSLTINELPKDWLVIFHDQQGLAAMSTLCSRDLEPLVKIKQGEHEIYDCDKCHSQFSLSGKLLKGPAVVDLPYYKLKQDSLLINQPRDTLYVIVGENVPRSWRLKIE